MKNATVLLVLLLTLCSFVMSYNTLIRAESGTEPLSFELLNLDQGITNVVDFRPGSERRVVYEPGLYQVQNLELPEGTAVKIIVIHETETIVSYELSRDHWTDDFTYHFPPGSRMMIFSILV